MVLSTLIPINWAASRSWETARIALPSRVRRTMNCSTIINTIEIVTIMICSMVMTTSPKWKVCDMNPGSAG